MCFSLFHSRTGDGLYLLNQLMTLNDFQWISKKNYIAGIWFEYLFQLISIDIIWSKLITSDYFWYQKTSFDEYQVIKFDNQWLFVIIFDQNDIKWYHFEHHLTSRFTSYTSTVAFLFQKKRFINRLGLSEYEHCTRYLRNKQLFT